MNKENIQKIITSLEEIDESSKIGFNMSHWIEDADPEGEEGEDKSGHNCGTVACIAGWGHWLGRPDRVKTPAHSYFQTTSTSQKAREFLDLNEEDSERLFHGGLGEYLPYYETFEDNLDLDEIKLEDAIKVLKHLVETGDVDWEII